MSEITDLKIAARDRLEKFRGFHVHDTETKKTAQETLKEIDSDLKSLDGKEGSEYAKSLNEIVKGSLQRGIEIYDLSLKAAHDEKKVREKKIADSKKPLQKNSEDLASQHVDRDAKVVDRQKRESLNEVDHNTVTHSDKR